MNNALREPPETLPSLPPSPRVRFQKVQFGDTIRFFAAASAKELGVPYVIAKAASLRMGEILRRVGADEIIYPEKESAEMTARRLLSSDFLEFFDLGSELSVFSMKPKKEWVGKTLRELDLRGRLKLNVIAMREGGHTSATMDPDRPLSSDAELFAVADHEALDRILH